MVLIGLELLNKIQTVTIYVDQKPNYCNGVIKSIFNNMLCETYWLVNRMKINNFIFQIVAAKSKPKR